MSASIHDVAAVPVGQTVAHAPHPAVSPYPDGPPTSSSSAAVSGGDATTTTANADGSITTTVIDGTGDTVSTSTSAPARHTGPAATPVLDIQA